MRRKFVSLLAALAMVGAGLTMSAPAQAIPKKPTVPQLQKAEIPKPGSPAVKAPKGRPGAIASLADCSGGASSCYEYSQRSQTLASGDEADGAYAEYSVSHPYLDSSRDSHTLAEMSASGPGNNIVEVGWNVDPFTYGDSLTHLFIYSWVNNVGQGYNGGGGWSDAVGCSPCAGDAITGDVGTTKSFSLEHIGTDWWALYNGNYLGAWPDSTWSGAFTDTNLVQLFGEIATLSNKKSCSDMGSGAHAGTSPSGLIQNYSLTGSSATPDLDFSIVTTSAEWAQTTLGSPAITGLRYGGEGWNSIGTALGVRDHCAPNAQGTPASSSMQGWQEECPDNNGTTGCTSAWSQAWSTATIGTCVALPNPGVLITNAVWNNSGSSGKTFAIYRTGTCGGSSQSYGNAVKAVLGAGWDGTNVRAFKRTA